MKNLLLNQLSQDDFQRLEPYLKINPFKQHTVLFEAEWEIEHVYLPTGGVVSLVVTLETGELVEAAMVGADGVVGASAALDGRISLSRGIVQLAGDIVVCSLDGLKSAAMQSPNCCRCSFVTSRRCMLRRNSQRHVLRQTTYRHVYAVGCSTGEGLAGTDTLNFTQEYLAEMLGVRRTTVTVEAHTLQSAGLIKYARGKIQIVDAEALHDGACECFETVKRHYARLLGTAK